VGSRLSIDKAYIAGFLDGDGSIMLQIKKRSDTIKGYRFMATICFYQDTRHEDTLFWIQKCLRNGYISRRNDAMTELRINGFSKVEDILEDLRPYIRFKKVQAEAMLKACRILKMNLKKLSNKQLIEVIDLIITIQNSNYVSRRKKTREELMNLLGLTP
jgi:hypothetical protein